MALRYVCSQCGWPGIPDSYTAIDPRYTTGRCTGEHRGRQWLIREDVLPKITEKKKKEAPGAGPPRDTHPGL